MNTTPRAINYPFLKGKNPHMRKLQEWIDQCILEDYEPLSQKFQEMHVSTHIGKLTGYYFPTADFELASVICRWMLTIGIYDDVFAPKGGEKLKSLGRRMQEVYQGKDITPEDTGLERILLKQIELVMQGVQPFSTTEWRRRFMENNTRYINTVILDSDTYSYRKEVKFPSLKEYMKIREDNVVIHPCLNLAEITSDCILSAELLEHKVIQRIHQVTVLLTATCNDFFSVEKERKNKEALNLILVLENELHCGFEEACDKAIEIHDNLVKEFLSLRHAILNFEGMNESLHRYCDALEFIIHGNLVWHQFTPRYAGKN